MNVSAFLYFCVTRKSPCSVDAWNVVMFWTFEYPPEIGASKVRLAQKLWVVEGQRRHFFQQTEGRVQRQRLLCSAKVDARDIQRYARAYAGLSVLRRSLALRLSGSERWCSRLRLKAEAIGHVPTFRLRKLDEHVLRRRIAGRILHRRIDLVEEREVVEVPLRLK